MQKEEEEEGDSSVAFFFFLLQQNKEKKATGASCRLLRGATTKNKVERRLRKLTLKLGSGSFGSGAPTLALVLSFRL
jgi:hypothetical protein